jgi:hypothetical protein
MGGMEASPENISHNQQAREYKIDYLLTIDKLLRSRVHASLTAGCGERATSGVYYASLQVREKSIHA